MNIINSVLTGLILWASRVSPLPTCDATAGHGSRSNISIALFDSLEELARIVDISYCVGTTGIQKPFQCVSRCSEFEGFDLVTVSATTMLGHPG